MNIRAELNIFPSGFAKAVGKLIIDDEIEIKGFRILDGKNGLWVAPPSHLALDKDGKPRIGEDGKKLYVSDIFLPKDGKLTAQITSVFLEAYYELVPKPEPVSSTRRRSTRPATPTATVAEDEPW